MNIKIKVNCKKFEQQDGTFRYALSTKLMRPDGTSEYVPVYFTKAAKAIIDASGSTLNKPFDLTIDKELFNVLPANDKYKKRALVDFSNGKKFSIDFIKSDWTPAEKMPTLNDAFIFEQVDD